MIKEMDKGSVVPICASCGNYQPNEKNKCKKGAIKDMLPTKCDQWEHEPDIDKEKLLVWMREIQSHYHEVWHDEKLDEIIRHDASVSWGLCLAMGMEIKSGRFDVNGQKSACTANMKRT